MQRVKGKYDAITDTYAMHNNLDMCVTYKTNRELSQNFNELYDILARSGENNKLAPPVYIKDGDKLVLKYADGLLDIQMNVDNEEHRNEVGPKLVGYTVGQRILRDSEPTKDQNLFYNMKQVLATLGLAKTEGFCENVATYVCYVYNRYLKNYKTYPDAYEEIGDKFRQYWYKIFNNFPGGEQQRNLHIAFGNVLWPVG